MSGRPASPAPKAVGNPFETVDPDTAPYLPPAPLREAWEAGCRRLLLCGANGMGKSSALAAWGTWAAQAQLPVRAPRQPSPGAPWWLLDEAQRHRESALRDAVLAAAARGQGIAIASHLHHRWALRGLGFTVVKLSPLRTDEALATVLQAYLDHAGVEWAIEASALTLWRRLCGGSIRAALKLGYELYEDLGAVAGVAAADVDRAAGRLRADAPDVLAWRRLERRHRRPDRR